MSWPLFEKVTEDQSFTNPTDKHVARSLAHRTNCKTGKCNPSVECLVKDTGLSESAVKEARRRLKKLGWIDYDEGYSFSGNARSSRYSLLRWGHLDSEVGAAKVRSGGGRSAKWGRQNAPNMYGTKVNIHEPSNTSAAGATGATANAEPVSPAASGNKHTIAPSPSPTPSATDGSSLADKAKPRVERISPEEFVARYEGQIRRMPLFEARNEREFDKKYPAAFRELAGGAVETDWLEVFGISLNDGKVTCWDIGATGGGMKGADYGKKSSN